MRFQRTGAALAAVAALAGLAACGSSSTSTASGSGSSGSSSSGSGSGSGSGKPSLVIGSQAFPENEVLAYVYADALKADGFSVSVKPNLGPREVTAPALQNGAIDMIPEYLGNYLTFLDPSAGVLTVSQTYSTLKPLASSKALTLGNYSQAADADAIAVTAANAQKYGLKSIPDLSRVASGWTFGGPPECATRITCVPGLEKYYGLHFKAFKALDEDGPLTVSALSNGDVQAARIFSSDTTIASNHFVVLADPKDFQGAGNIVPVVRSGKATSETLAVLNKVSAALTTADLVGFNVAVQTNHDDAASVASAFVAQHKL